MNTSVGKDHTMKITGDHQFSSTNYRQTVSENKTVTVIGDLKEETSTTTHRAKNGDVLIQSAGVAKILGKLDAKVNKG